MSFERKSISNKLTLYLTTTTALKINWISNLKYQFLAV